MGDIHQKLKAFGLSRLARELGTTPSAICQWGGKIPPERVLSVEKITGISRHDLRPDIYPMETEKPFHVGGEMHR